MTLKIAFCCNAKGMRAGKGLTQRISRKSAVEHTFETRARPVKPHRSDGVDLCALPLHCSRCAGPRQK
ncbi:hypothetical protein ALP22_200125 [Pseudomonas coronafaciens pv. porri]|nr:hypothetical protein ALP22_200125 [Pseudomonas coronafaciens pv. porri]